MDPVDAYLSQLNPDQFAALERIRKIVASEVPEAEQCISYGMPAFKFQGKYLMGYAAFKKHLSLFPASEPVTAMHDALKEFKTSKGTIQFTTMQPVPELIIRQLLAIRIRAILG